MTVFVDQLSPGDRFMWCGQTVEVQKTTPANYYKRGPSRYVWVRFGVEELRLHYYDDETVQVFGPGNALRGSRAAGVENI